MPVEALDLGLSLSSRAGYEPPGTREEGCGLTRCTRDGMPEVTVCVRASTRALISEVGMRAS